MIIGIGTPINQSRAPLPKPMTSLLDEWFGQTTRGVEESSIPVAVWSAPN